MRQRVKEVGCIYRVSMRHSRVSMRSENEPPPEPMPICGPSIVVMSMTWSPKRILSCAAEDRDCPSSAKELRSREPGATSWVPKASRPRAVQSKSCAAGELLFVSLMLLLQSLKKSGAWWSRKAREEGSKKLAWSRLWSAKSPALGKSCRSPQSSEVWRDGLLGLLRPEEAGVCEYSGS